MTRGQEAHSQISELTPLERRALSDLMRDRSCSPREPLARCDRCWSRWIRARLMEHLRGQRWWQELDRGDFGLLRTELHSERDLVTEIVTAIEAGSENLAVISWACRTDKPLDVVVGILTLLEINERRLRRFSWLTRVSRCATHPAAATSSPSPPVERSPRRRAAGA